MSGESARMSVSVLWNAALMAFAIDTKLGRHAYTCTAARRRRSAFTDPHVKRSKVKVVRAVIDFSAVPACMGMQVDSTARVSSCAGVSNAACRRRCSKSS